MIEIFSGITIGGGITIGDVPVAPPGADVYFVTQDDVFLITESGEYLIEE